MTMIVVFGILAVFAMTSLVWGVNGIARIEYRARHNGE